MNNGKKACRINPFNEKFESSSISDSRQDGVKPFIAKNKIVCIDICEEESLSNSGTLTKSKRKRLRIKKAKLRQSENKPDINNPVKDPKSNSLLKIVTYVNSDVTNSVSINNINLDSAKNTNDQETKACENILSDKQFFSDHNLKISKEPEMKANNIPNKEKSKEDILAERQAKKLAKQNAKKKDRTETSRNANKDGEMCKNLTKIDSLKNETAVNITNKSGNSQIKSVVESNDIDEAQKSDNDKSQDPCDAVDNSKEGAGADVVDGEIRIRMTPTVLSNFNEGVASGKSRIQVSLEREAKKLVKLAKKQGKETPAVTIKENIPVEPSNNIIAETLMEKSKAELKAERRAKQEAQRAAKEAQKMAGMAPPTVVEKKILKKSPEVKRDVKAEEKVSEFKVHQHKLFSHLCIEQQPLDGNTVVHSAIVELGKKYGTRVISGSNARCVSLLLALKQVITDYKASTTSDLNRGLEAELAGIGSYLSRARPLSVSMTNSLRYLRSHLTQTSDLPDEEAKKKLLESIDTFIREQVDVAGQAISNTVQEKISNGDVILTYGCSSLVWRCLKESYQAGKEFSVVVVDGGPWYEGRELLRRLAALSIPCTYLLISAVGFAITKISKVLLGAHALLANGYVMSRTGSAMIALTASAHSVPVLVCCETYKFCERVQADSFVYNELGGGDEASLKGVKWLSPIYDITPPDLVTAVVTELAILPCTSVPVVLRVKPSDIHHAT